MAPFEAAKLCCLPPTQSAGATLFEGNGPNQEHFAPKAQRGQFPTLYNGGRIMELGLHGIAFGRP